MMAPEQGTSKQLIHRSAWKKISVNFALTEFYKVRILDVLGSRPTARAKPVARLAYSFATRVHTLALATQSRTTKPVRSGCSQSR